MRQKKFRLVRNNFAGPAFAVVRHAARVAGNGKGAFRGKEERIDVCRFSGHDGGSERSMNKARAAAGGGLKRAGSRADPLGPNSEIGRKLKQYYEELVSEAVPDRFEDLLRQLEDREQPVPANGSDRE